MKNYLLILLLIVLAACGRKESPEKETSSKKPEKKLPKNEKKLSENEIQESGAASEKVFVTWGGKCTNLVFDGDHDKFLLKDKRTPEELQKEIDANPDNPDAWFALAKCFWDSRYWEIDKAKKYFQKAHELAPDALMPRLYLAEKEMAQLNYKEGLKIFREAYPCAKTDKDKRRFSKAVAYHARLRIQKGLSPEPVIKLLEEIADDTPYASKYIADIYFNSNRKEEALPWIKQGLAATTNIELQTDFLQKFRSIKSKNEKDEEFEAEYEEAVAKATIPEFEKALLAFNKVEYHEREEKYPGLCRRAASFATNCEQRIRAFRSLADLYANNGQKVKLNNLIKEIIGTNEPPKKSARQIAGWLERVNLTNEASEIIQTAILSETNELSVAGLMLMKAKRGKEIDENVVLKLASRFPSNAAVLTRIADFFAREEWHDREIEFRKKALKFLTDPLKQNIQVSRLIKKHLKFDEISEAETLISDYSNILSNNASLALSLSHVYCKKGQTNDAFELLISSCENAKYEKDKEKIIKKLLDFRWLEKAQKKRAADFAWETVEKFTLDIRIPRQTDIYNLLIKSYISLKQPEDALKACKKVFTLGGGTPSFHAVCRLVNNPAKIESFVRSILSEGSSQTHFYTTAARACERAQLPELACDLFVQAWKNTKDNWQKIDIAKHAVRLANELGWESVCDDILNELVEKCKDGKIESWSLWSISRMMQELNMDDKYEEIAKVIIDNSKGDRQTDAICQLGWWYMSNNNTSGVKNLIATHFEGKELDIENSLAVADLYFATGDNQNLIPLFEKIELQLTNYSAISRYGTRLLWSFNYVGEKERADKLLRKWIDDPEFPAKRKLDFLYYLQHNGNANEAIKISKKIVSDIPEGWERGNALRTLMDLYASAGDIEGVRSAGDELLSSPNVSQWQLRNIAQKFNQLNLPNEALAVLDQLLEKAGDNKGERARILGEQVALYLKTGDAKSAIEAAKESGELRPDDAGPCILLGNAYTADGQPRKAIDEYCRALKLSDSIEWQRQCCKKIGDILHNSDVDFDPMFVADTLLEENRNIQTLMTAATLLSAGNNFKRAENLISEAANSAKIDSQRAPIYEQWVQITRNSGDEKQLLTALQSLYSVADPTKKASAGWEISRMLMESGDYETAISESRNMLKDLENNIRNRWAYSQIKANITRSYMELGDKEEAWKAAQEIPGNNSMWSGGGNWGTYMDFARQLGKTEEATAVLEKGFENAMPNSKSGIAIHLLHAYQDAGRKEDIEKLLEDSEALFKSVKPWKKTQVAEFYKEAGQKDKALEILKDEAINGNWWNQFQTFNKLFELYKDEDKLDEALEWAGSQPESSSLNAMMAAIYKEKEEPEKAVELYSKTLETMGADNRWQRDMLRQQLAEAAAKSDDKEELIEKVVKEIKSEVNEDEKQARQQAARMYQAAEMYDDAIDEFKKAIKLTRNEKELRGLGMQYADCLGKAEEYDEAASEYKDILKDEDIKWEQRIGIQNKLADAYKKGKRPNKAKDVRDDIIDTCETFLKEHKYGSRAMSARFALADAYLNADDKSKARKTLEKIRDKYKHTSYAKRAEKKLKNMK